MRVSASVGQPAAFDPEAVVAICTASVWRLLNRAAALFRHNYLAPYFKTAARTQQPPTRTRVVLWCHSLSSWRSSRRTDKSPGEGALG